MIVATTGTIGGLRNRPPAAACQQGKDKPVLSGPAGQPAAWRAVEIRKQSAAFSAAARRNLGGVRRIPDAFRKIFSFCDAILPGRTRLAQLGG